MKLNEIKRSFVCDDFWKEWNSLHITHGAERMRWAAEREATRVEDEAYSLLGIFGISLPTLYGEGRHAFQRLQEEIL